MRSASRALAVLIGLVLTGAGAPGQDPEEAAPPRPAPGKAAPRRTPRTEGAAATLQAEVEVRYLRLQGLMAKLLEAIDKAQETGRVAAALDRSEELKVSERLRGIQSLLGARDYRAALDEEKAVEKDLERILRILKGLDEAEELKRAAEELEALKDDLERLQKLSVEEEKHLEETRALEAESLSAEDPRAREESSQLSRKQRETQRKADDLRKSVEREGAEERRDAREDQAGQEGEKGAGEEGQEGKEGGGTEGGKQGGKSGQGKQGGKSGEGKSGQGKQAGGKQGGQSKAGESSQGEQGQSSAGKKSGGESEQKDRRQARASARTKAARALRRASESMEGASQRLQAGNLKGAEEDEEEALAELEQAAEELEEEIERREEENQEELARRLAQRLEAMLVEQEVISLETKHADRSAAAGDTEPEPAAKDEKVDAPPKPKDMEEADAEDAEPADPRSLARRERSLMTDAEDALRILEADQTSVTAPSIIERVRDDLGNVATLLDGGETGEVTQLLQADIERTLRELIEALTPPERPPGPEGQPPPPRPRPPGKRKDLVTPAMEIKMLRSSQQRLRERTEKLEELGLLPRKDAEPAPEPPGDVEPLDQQARKLAEAQSKLAGLMDALVAKYPVIDQLLLGAENELGEENREPVIPLLPPPPEEGGGGKRLEGSPGETPPEKGDGDESSL